MITALLELAQDPSVLGDPGFSRRLIHWFIDLDENGTFLGMSPAIGQSECKGSGLVDEAGKMFSRPAFFFMRLDKKGKVVATAGGGKAVAELGCGSVVEVFGVQIDAPKNKAPKILPLKLKDQYKPKDFVELHKSLSEQNPELAALQAIQRFLSQNFDLGKAGLPDPQIKRLAKQEISFRVSGHPVIAQPEFRTVWRRMFDKQYNEVVKKLPPGKGMFPEMGGSLSDAVLTPVFPHISGVPDGGPWCPLNSFDKVSYQSFGLDDMTTQMSLSSAQRASATLNYLLSEPSTHLRMDDTVAVFWASAVSGDGARIERCPFVTALASADPLEVKDFITGLWGQGAAVLQQPHRFYCAILSSPKSRVTVRSWHSDTLSDAQAHVRTWLEVASLCGEPSSISQMAECTVVKAKNSKPARKIYTELFDAAISGNPIPHRYLAMAIQRQGLELAQGTDKKKREQFNERLRARTALIRIYLRQNIGEAMSPDHHDSELNAGYLCGRLLALLDKIHIEAHRQSGGTNSSPANRSYAAASTTPALAFPQLCSLARVHLNKIGGGWANRLEHGYSDQGFEGLAAVCARLRDSAGGQFPRTLPLEDQGRFAIGFYYERTRKWPSPPKKPAVQSDQDTQSAIAEESE